MAEYIEREELINQIRLMVNRSSVVETSLSDISAKTICGLILEAPTADVVEVKHGEWITPTKIKSMNIAVPHCSLCGNVPCDKAFYCPYCGAKMDGATDTNVGGKLKEGAEE